jgi:signal transduction histidine kinase
LFLKVRMVFKKRLASILSSESALLGVVMIAAFSMIIINYFTIKILSTARAYVAGESFYSKGQKDAARNLILFVNSGDALYWNSFIEELSVPIGDSLARVGLLRGDDRARIEEGFLAGRNHPDDIDDLIWMFEKFQHVEFMQNAIQIWKEADYLVGQELALAYELKGKMDLTALSLLERTEAVGKINNITTELTTKERAFSSTLGDASRDIKAVLWTLNIVMTLLVVGGTSTYAWLMFRRLREKNRDLSAINEELDKFVYSASHDLRAPITSVRGLIELVRMENDPSQIAAYLQMMERSLNKQDLFIRDIIALSRNKKTSTGSEEVNLTRLVDDVIDQHRFMEDAKTIVIRRDLHTDCVLSDEFRVRIILSNLVSNAIKYSDMRKAERVIVIRTRQNNGTFLMEVEDNGQGIRQEDQAHVFEMFYAAGSHTKSSGLGLYITLEAVQRLKGKISFQSQPGVGTTFTVALPQTVAHPVEVAY